MFYLFIAGMKQKYNNKVQSRKEQYCRTRCQLAFLFASTLVGTIETRLPCQQVNSDSVSNAMDKISFFFYFDLLFCYSPSAIILHYFYYVAINKHCIFPLLLLCHLHIFRISLCVCIFTAHIIVMLNKYCIKIEYNSVSVLSMCLCLSRIRFYFVCLIQMGKMHTHSY